MDHFSIIEADSPLVAAAIHNGHHIDRSLYPHLNLGEHERMREEDPYTDYLAEVCPTQILVNTSRFSVDMNRPRNKAIYKNPEDAWGLQVWKAQLTRAQEEAALEQYDRFYRSVGTLLNRIIQAHGYFIVIDLHTYNHRRDDIWSSAPRHENPDINLGTESIPGEWRDVSDRFRKKLMAHPFRSGDPDVRENVKFKGGHFSKWINNHFGKDGFAIAIEFKKTFMDEWTGRVDIHALNELKQALATALPVLKSPYLIH